jgi:hypothetical protein
MVHHDFWDAAVDYIIYKQADQYLVTLQLEISGSAKRQMN